MVALLQQLDLARCPHCRIDKPTPQKKNGFETTGIVTKDKRYWGIYACARCGGVIAVWALQDGQEMQRAYPQPEEISDVIPEPAREYLRQAMDSLHSPAAAVMVAASAVDAMLKDKGYSDNSLYSRINQAAEDHLITSEMAEWAHEVRLDANDQRHADENAQMSDGRNAEHCVEFVRALAEFMYALPARIKKGRGQS